MHFITTLATAATLLPFASAHGVVQRIIGGGQPWAGGIPWQVVDAPAWHAQNFDYGYVSDVSNINITCHKGAYPGSQYIPLAAGSEVKMEWSGSWPHPGPVMSYLARCPGSCTQADPATLQFFKIAESGLLKNTNNTWEGLYWASNALRDNSNTGVVKLPSNIKPGNYVLRHEILALHAAYNVSGAQFYPQCVNLRISGHGNLEPTGTPATKLYNQTGPGVLINIYWPTPTKYAIPGPPVAHGLEF
ncbi:hypothetical protein ANO11243_017790 [Dothideomycetidae sp. 11243]|nr:hypothetical protein ANO11243_017790 [fungal sp. No.11243]